MREREKKSEQDFREMQDILNWMGIYVTGLLRAEEMEQRKKYLK